MSLRAFIAGIHARLFSRLRAGLRRHRLEEEMECELACHLENLTSDLIRSGFSPEEAARRARIALGPALMHKEGMRAALGLRWWDEFRADLRYGARLLRKSPGFTAMAATSLALAIGANTTIFSVTKQILYERLAVPDAAQLRLLTWTGTEKHVAVHHIHGDYNPLPGGRVESPVFSYAVYQQLRARNTVLGDLLAFRESGLNATIHNEPRRVLGEMVSGNYYAVLGVRPQLGRAIEPSDEMAPGQPVAVISDSFWEREFGRSPAALGQWIKLNGQPVMIVGVNPPEFTGAKSVLQPETPDVTVPLAIEPLLTPPSDGKSWLTNPAQWWVNIMGRARPGVRDAAAQAALDAELASIVRATMPIRPSEDIPRLFLADGSHGLFEQEQVFARPMAVLMTLVGLVLLLACANVANLMLARGAQRRREMSVRMAMGAGRGRILRQMLVESLLLAALGGAGGLAVGDVGRLVIPKMVEFAWEHSALKIHFDWKVFAFTAAITLMTGILFGLAPALAAARAEVTHGLKETSHTTTRRRKGMSSKALVGFQIALSTMLVIGAGLFLRTLVGLSRVDVGFRTDHLLLAEINPPVSRYPAGKDVALAETLEQSFSSIPGVDSDRKSVV